jgi:hypothetical protein
MESIKYHTTTNCYLSKSKAYPPSSHIYFGQLCSACLIHKAPKESSSRSRFPMLPISTMTSQSQATFNNFARKCRFNSYDRDPDELASLMQPWLFFGLISEVVGCQVDHDFVVRSRYNGEDEVRFIDSRLDGALADIVTERFRSLRHKGRDHRTLIWSTIEKMIKVADARALEFEKVITSQHLIQW